MSAAGSQVVEIYFAVEEDWERFNELLPIRPAATIEACPQVLLARVPSLTRARGVYPLATVDHPVPAHRAAVKELAAHPMTSAEWDQVVAAIRGEKTSRPPTAGPSTRPKVPFDRAASHRAFTDHRLAGLIRGHGSHAAALLWFVLWDRADAAGVIRGATVSALARVTGMNRETVRGSIRVLEAAGLLTTAADRLTLHGVGGG